LDTTRTLNVRVTGPLGEFVSARTGPDGLYDNVSEYVRDLIRRDMAASEAEMLARLQAELRVGFSAPDADFVEMNAESVIARGRVRAGA
jgi:antitoxin ParD1/3/4